MHRRTFCFGLNQSLIIDFETEVIQLGNLVQTSGCKSKVSGYIYNQRIICIFYHSFFYQLLRLSVVLF